MPEIEKFACSTPSTLCIMIYFAQQNISEKTFDLLSRLPEVGFAGMLGNFALGKFLKNLNKVIQEKGEPALMKYLFEVQN